MNNTLRTSVRPFGGAPAIFVNDMPVTGLMHWNRSMERVDASNFSSSGVKFFSFIGNINLDDVPGEESVGDGTNFHPMTHDFIDENMERILAGCPDALVIPRFRLQASEGWKKRHPGKQMRYFNIETGVFEDSSMVSLAYEEWISVALAALARSVEYCEQRWSEHIFGYHSGLGECTEHVWFWGPKIADYHPEMLAFFRSWLRKKYENDDAFRIAWNRKDISLADAEFPPPSAFLHMTPSARAIWDPGSERDVIDMLRCHSEYMAGLVVRQAKCVKKRLQELGAEKIFGAFYGYANLPSNSISHYAVGHDAHEIVLNCKELDFLSAPVGYTARHPGGVSTGQILPGSVTLSDKLYFAEDDTGTMLSNIAHNVRPATAEQSSQMLERGFFDVWRSGGTQWFMDLFGEGTYRDPRLMKTIGRLAEFAERHMSDRESRAEIAVFISDKSLSYSKTFNFLTGSMINHGLNEIAAIGSAFDLFRLEDLPLLAEKKRLGQYKFAIVLNAHYIDSELRKTIDSELKKDNRTILFFHAPGIIGDSKFDPESSSAVTGIQCILWRSSSPLITEVLFHGRRFSYGMQRNVNPSLFPVDPDAEPLGFVVVGTWIPFREKSNGALLVSKKFPSWRSILSVSPDMPSGLMTEFAREAGVHIYSDRGDQVLNAENWIAVHSKWTGPLEVRFPAPVTLRDAFTGKIVAENTDVFRKDTIRGENIVLEYVK